MNIIDAIQIQRAVKHFDADHSLTAAEEHSWLEATILASTGN